MIEETLTFMENFWKDELGLQPGDLSIKEFYLYDEDFGESLESFSQKMGGGVLRNLISGSINYGAVILASTPLLICPDPIPSFLTTTTLIYTIEAVITAAAGSRLALQ